MPLALEPPQTPWQAGSFRGRGARLLFGSMYEDHAIERKAFPKRSRVFCIASAGCTARAMAFAGHEVTAVDINPAQLTYARQRAEGAPAREGAAERLLSSARRLLPLCGWTRQRITEFLSMSEPEHQLRYWRNTLDTFRWKLALKTLLSDALLKLFYASPFLSALPRNFGACVNARLERTWASHPNRSNPYARSLLLGPKSEQPEPATPPIRFACADAAQYLESSPRRSFDAFSLSNIGDGASPAFLHRLHTAVAHAAAPDAIVITRSFKEPAYESPDNWAARDRSMLWGIVNVSRIDEQAACCLFNPSSN